MELHFANHGHSARPALFLALLLTLAGCGGPPRPSLIADQGGASAVELYDAGATELALGDEAAAEKSFRSSLSLARKSGLDFAPPHEGLARVHLRHNRLDAAEAEANHALELDRYWVRTYWVLGKVNERRGHEDLALVQYERALVIEPGDDENVAAAVDLLRRLGRDREAEEFQRRASGRQPPAAAGPGTRPSGAGGPAARPSGPAPAPVPAADAFTAARARLEPFFPDQVPTLSPGVLAVFSQPLLTRGALAVLLIADGIHGLAGALERAGNLPEPLGRPPFDLTGRPEEQWAVAAVGMGTLDLYPDGSFRPDQPLTRLTLSLWVEETIARLRNDRQVFSLYRGQPSPFPDLADGFYGLNAARIAVDLKLLAPRDGGRFAPDEEVGLDEGITVIRRLGPALLGEPADTTGAGGK